MYLCAFHMYIDIHRHSSDKGEADLILKNAFHNQDINSMEGEYFSVGLHPWHVKESLLDGDVKQVNEAARLYKVIAIGEAGLDKTIEVDIKVQLRAFEQQIEIARQLNIPMIIHCVRAYNEIISIRKNSKLKSPWIIHWFNASTEMANDLVKKNCYLSFGNSLFNENTKAYRAFTKIPVEYVFLETDDVNIPITEIYKKAAHLRQISIQDLKNQIKKNFTNCFGIEL